MADSSAAGATISADAENNRTDPVVQVDSSSDNDSAYAESDLTDTSSLRSWIHEYRVENNRTYHVVSSSHLSWILRTCTRPMTSRHVKREITNSTGVYDDGLRGFITG